MERAEKAPTTRPRVPRGGGRDALCAALIRIVAREGIERVTFRSVAAEAGVTHGLASYHFGSREEMIHEALRWAESRAIEQSRIGGGAGDLVTFAADVPRMVAEHPEEHIFQFDLALLALRRPALLPGVRESYDDYVEVVRESLSRLGVGDDEGLARAVFAAIDGLSLQQLLYGDPTRAQEGIAALQRVLALVAAHRADS
ncbi:MAG TPA: TetR family transcriptional regulator [Gaiellaceae bacterium]|nr:TetR family transcriptional regulator [Gaiellaceae bacterium]